MKFHPIASIALLLTTCQGCSAVPVKTSAPQEAVVQTDAGTLVCQYVDITFTGPEARALGLEGETIKHGTCTLNGSKLTAEVELAKRLYGLLGAVSGVR